MLRSIGLTLFSLISLIFRGGEENQLCYTKIKACVKLRILDFSFKIWLTFVFVMLIFFRTKRFRSFLSCF